MQVRNNLKIVHGTTLNSKLKPSVTNSQLVTKQLEVELILMYQRQALFLTTNTSITAVPSTLHSQLLHPLCLIIANQKLHQMYQNSKCLLSRKPIYVIPVVPWVYLCHWSSNRQCSRKEKPYGKERHYQSMDFLVYCYDKNLNY